MKLGFNNAVKRIPNVQTYAELVAQATAFVTSTGAVTTQPKQLTITYIDSDKDEIHIGDDSDLQIAYVVAIQTERKIKFLIRLPELASTEK